MPFIKAMTTIRYWLNEFKCGRTSVFDEERPGHPIKVSTKDMVKKSPWYPVSRPPGEDQRDCWHCRHLNWTHTKYSTWKIGHDNSIGEMGAAFADSTAFRDCWRNMDTSLHSRNKRTVKTVDFTRRMCSKEGENGSIDRKGHGHRFLGFPRHHLQQFAVV